MINLLTDPFRILNIFSIDLHNGVTLFVGIFLLFQFWLLIFMVFYVCMSRIIQKIITYRNKSAGDLLKKIIFNYMITSPQKRKMLIKQVKMKIVPRAQWSYLKRMILDQIKVIKGVEKSQVIQFYRELGLLQDDLLMLQSSRWWERLAAVIRLETLELKELIPVFKARTHDKHSLVSLIALRALRIVPLSEFMDEMFKWAPLLFGQRKHILIEILTHIVMRDPQEILNLFQKKIPLELKLICITVLGRNRILSGVTILSQTLSDSNADIVVEALVALAHIGDPSVLSQVELLMKHKSPHVRATAIGALVRLGSQNKISYLKAMQKDASMIVRKAVFKVLQEEVA